MNDEPRQLRSWRERIATPLNAPGEEIPEKTAQTNQTNQQTPNSLRVSKFADDQTNSKQTSAQPERRRPVVPYPLPVRWGRERGDIAVTDPWGEVHEMPYSDATPVWQAALRKKHGAD